MVYGISGLVLVLYEVIGKGIRARQFSRDVMLCSVAQLPGLWNDDSRMARFHTIIYLLGLLVGNPASLLCFGFEWGSE